MDFHRIISLSRLEDVQVTILNPTRSGDIYKTGKFAGYKSGVYGLSGPPIGVSRVKWIKKPMVLVAHNIADFGGKQHTSWVPCDNCEFDFMKPKEVRDERKMLIRHYRLSPIFGFGHWKDDYTFEKSGVDGVCHNLVLPFFRIQWGYLLKV